MDAVKIEWYGHSYFRVEAGGTSIVIDPHDGGSLNLPTYRVRADAVLVTHNHYDHNAVSIVEARKVYTWKRGSFRVGSIIVEGLPSYHDKSQGRLRGENTIYVIRANQIEIAHLGDLGHLPSDELARKLDGVDILMIPVGGVYTIDAYEAWEIVKTLGPKLVIPMHFWMPNMTVPLDPLERFLNIAKTRRLRLETNILEVALEDLPERTTVVVFQLPQ